MPHTTHVALQRWQGIGRQSLQAAQRGDGQEHRSHYWPLLAVLASVSSLTAGTSLAKQLFPILGAQGASALRVGLAAIILALIWRPWRWPLRSAQLATPVQFLGLACAAGSAVCWALYIVLGRRLRGIPNGQAASLGVLCAAVIVVPIGLAEAGAKLMQPSILLLGLAVAVVSSALPYSLEMLALRRLPPATFGVALASEPAVAAFMGMVVLNEHLNLWQWVAIFCIICAAMGSAFTLPSRAANEADLSTIDH